MGKVKDITILGEIMFVTIECDRVRSDSQQRLCVDRITLPLSVSCHHCAMSQI
jgi:hypothetical protein